MSKLPSAILDLSNWYLTLPIGEPKNALNIFNPELLTYSNDKYFSVNEDGDAICFRSFSGGATTKGSHNPRSELREMVGKEKACWSTTEGEHVMTFTGCTNKLPTTRPSTVIGQVHRGKDDVIEIRCWVPPRRTAPILDVFHDNIIYGTLKNNYALGDRYEIKVVASNGKIHVYCDDMATPKVSVDANYDTCFFKVGSYIQCNPVLHQARLDEWTESFVYSVDICHS